MNLFARSKIQPTLAEQNLADLLTAFQGRENPARLAWIAQVLRCKQRDVKALVQSLRETHRAPIGASRGKSAGYFVMLDADDYRIGLAGYRAQVLSALRILRALDDPERLRELLGQVRLEAA